jgi:hypothetical protein
MAGQYRFVSLSMGVKDDANHVRRAEARKIWRQCAVEIVASPETREVTPHSSP